MMWWYGHGFGWGELLVGGLMMLLFWGGLIALVALLFRGLVSPGGRSRGESAGSAPANRALNILQERYARGEISKAEYEEIRQELES